MNHLRHVSDCKNRGLVARFHHLFQECRSGILLRSKKAFLTDAARNIKQQGNRQRHLFRIGDVAAENLTHVLVSFAMSARLTLHVDVLRGANDHHRAEAAFKALALALRHAIARDGSDQVPSTKGVL